MATFKIVLNVLVNFLWFGGLVFPDGGLWRFGRGCKSRLVNRCSGAALPSLPDLPEAMWGATHGRVEGEDVRW